MIPEAARATHNVPVFCVFAEDIEAHCYGQPYVSYYNHEHHIKNFSYYYWNDNIEYY